MKKILLIEDDEIMRENTSEILELAQYSVINACDGKEGVELAKQHRPDLIISDIMMPKLDGYGVLHILSKDPVTASIPFIFLTAKAEKSEFRKGMILGADDYLTKPFEETDLLNAIETRLKKSELMKQDFHQSMEGFNQFLDEAQKLDAMENLSRDRNLIKYKKRDTVYYEGDEPQYLYFLNSGKIKLYKSHDDGKEYVINMHAPGDFFGYTALLEGACYEECAFVVEDAEIGKIPKDDFLSLLYKNRDVCQKFIKILSHHVVEKEKQLLSLAYDTVKKRLAEALIQLEDRYHKSNQSFTIKLTREDLASMVGTATETVIRCLGDLKSQGIIEIKGREIKVLDSKKLKQVY